MKSFNTIFLDKEETIKTLQEIENKNRYSCPEKTISHFLSRIYPDPASMSVEDKKFYCKIKSSLENLWRTTKGKKNHLSLLLL